jgi:hypothetical protein
MTRRELAPHPLSQTATYDRATYDVAIITYLALHVAPGPEGAGRVDPETGEFIPFGPTDYDYEPFGAVSG